eukprot:gene1476-2102_t
MLQSTCRIIFTFLSIILPVLVSGDVRSVNFPSSGRQVYLRGPRESNSKEALGYPESHRDTNRFLQEDSEDPVTSDESDDVDGEDAADAEEEDSKAAEATEDTSAPAEDSAEDSSGDFMGSAAGAAGGAAVGSLLTGLMGTIKKYKDDALKVKKEIQKELPGKKKKFDQIGKEYKKKLTVKADRLKEDGENFKSDVEQAKAAMQVVQELMQEMQEPGALDQIQKQADLAASGAQAGGEVAAAHGDAAATSAANGDAPPAVDEEAAKQQLRAKATTIYLTKHEKKIKKAFPKMGGAIINATSDDERKDIFEDAMEGRLAKFQAEFNVQKAVLVGEIDAIKKEMLELMGVEIDDLKVIIVDMPIIGQRLVDELVNAWLQCKEQVAAQEVPEIPNPITAIQEKLAGGGSGSSGGGGIMAMFKGKVEGSYLNICSLFL